MIKKEVIMPQLNRGNGKKTSRWFLYYSIKNPATGLMVRFRIYDGFGECLTIDAKEEHAKKLLRTWRNKLLKGYNPFFEQDKIEYASRIKYDHLAAKTGRMVETEKNIGYYVSLYLDYIRADKNLRPSTFTTYKSKLRIFCQWLNLKEMDNCQIRFYNLSTIKLFNTYLKDKRALAGKSMNQYNVTLHGFFEYLIKEKKGVCFINPVEGMKSYPENSAHHRAYSEGYIDKIKERIADSDPWLWLMVKVLFNTLLRPTELRFLQMKHIDWVDGLIHLPGSISKNHRNRTITIPIHLLKDLKAAGYHNEQPEMFFFGSDRKPAEKRASKNYLYNQMKTILLELNVPQGFTLYSWKHTGVQQLAKKKVSLMFIKAQLGHASYDQMIPYIEELLAQGNDEMRYDAPAL